MFTQRATRGLKYAIVLTLGFSTLGCVSVKAPERINVNSRRTGHVNAPRTSSHADCENELAKAYDELHYLRDKVAKLERENDKLDDQLDRCEDALDRCKDRWDD